MAVRRGAYRWTIERPDRGMNIATPGASQQAGEHRIIRNWRVDREDWRLRGGATAIPTAGAIGASGTVGAKGLYAWYSGDGNRHIYGAFPTGAKVSLYEITTAAATHRGGAFDTTHNIAMAGLRDAMYVSDGRTRLQKVTGGSSAEAATLDGPGVYAEERSVYIVRPRVIIDRTWVIGTPPHAGNYPEPEFSETWPFPLWSYDAQGNSSWTASGTGLSMSVETGLGHPVANLPSQWGCRVQATASIITGARVFYSYGTGGTSALGGVHFWAKSSRLSEFLKLELVDANGSARVRDLGIEFNQTGRWEFKQYHFDGLPRVDRQNMGSARFVVVDNTATFTVDFSNMYLDGLQAGDYEVRAALYDSDSEIESPLGDTYQIHAERGPRRHSAFSFPAVRSIDSRPDKVRWYRRGGASPEWRLAVETDMDSQAWDFGADMDMGNIAEEVPPPPPRAKYMAPFGQGRMLYANGLDVGDYRMAIPTGLFAYGTMLSTNMNRVTVGGWSRGVEFYAAGPSPASGTFVIKLMANATAVRKATVGHGEVSNNTWNEALWTGPYRVEPGSGVYGITYSGVADMLDCRIGAYTSGAKASYAHLLDYPDRVWISRQDRPTYCDRLTSLDAFDSDGFWVDLPDAGAGHAITGVGRHGSDNLLFTRSTMALLRGTNAADTSLIEIHSRIGCVSHDAIEECSDWTLWPSGAAGDVQVRAFGPELRGAAWLPSPHEGAGISTIGGPVKPILDAVSDPTKMSASYKGGRYYLFLGETVTYDEQSYNVLVFDFATFSWVSDLHGTERMKTPRFAVTLPDTEQLLAASPASSAAGNDTNQVWQYDSEDTYLDGTSTMTHLYESRRMGAEGARITRLRSVDIGMTSADAGDFVVEPVVESGTVGRLTKSPSTITDGQLTFPRFGVKAQGRKVGVRVSGTAATAMAVYDYTLHLDRKR